MEDADAVRIVVHGQPTAPAATPTLFGFGAKKPGGVTPGSGGRGRQSQTPAERVAEWYMDRAAKKKVKEEKVRAAEAAYR